MEFPSNLINKNILKFYASNEKDILYKAENYFNDDATINCTEICKLLKNQCNVFIEKEFGSYKYEDFLLFYQQLQPIFYHSQKIIKTVSIESLHLQWLGDNITHVKTSLNEVIYNTQTASVERVLMLTAMLENALGNVYFTLKANAPPHLLRDLLNTAELLEVFGIEMLLFLKILMGTPKSINLRNIVWHGFPKPHEIPAYYVNILLLTAHTMGYALQCQNFKLKQREQIADFTNYLEKLEDYFRDSQFTFDTLEHTFQAENFCLNSDYKLYWQQLFQYYKDNKYWKFVILVLPQIELLLRLVYGHANEYDISAKLDEYYITMDTIFECDVATTTTTTNTNAYIKKNKLLIYESAITEGALKCMYDLFIAPNGPRLRDKVSHGEVTMIAINNSMLCHILMHLSLNLLNATAAIATNAPASTNECVLYFNNYESKFHINCQSLVALKNTNKHLNDFSKCNFATDLQCSNANLHVKQLLLSIKNIEIFQRPKMQNIAMLLILKIAQLLKHTCVNYVEALEERSCLLAQRELHSKRRRTLEKLQNALPQIFQTLFSILKTLAEIFIQLLDVHNNIYAVNKFDALLRFLKHILKICENLLKYSHKSSNEWIKALEMCRKFNEAYERFYN